jgi:pimeloyl-ACP methyl ester carboxylesterase
MIPGFLAGDGSLGPMLDALRAAGHDAHAGGIRCNIGCSEASLARVGAAAERLAERSGGRIALVGHSRGGLFARVLARRRPDLVASVITLGSPHRDQLAIHPLLWAVAATLATAGTLRLGRGLRWSCGRSGCCVDFIADLAAPLPAGVGELSIYSRSDGVVDWRACLDPDAPSLEVASSHCGMIVHAPTVWAVAAAISNVEPAGEARARN